jgi:hypothetical protein
MRRLMSGLVVALAMLSTTVLGVPGARAGLVQYATAGGFGSSQTSSTSFTLPGLLGTEETLTAVFTTAGPTTIATMPGLGELGEFKVSLNGLAVTPAHQDLDAPITLVLNQVSPAASTGTLTGDLTGRLYAGLGTNLEVVFANDSVTLGNIKYTLYEKVFGVFVPLSAMNDTLSLGTLGTVFSGQTVTTALYAQVTDLTVQDASLPEPSTLAGAAGAAVFLGLAYAGRWWRARTVV